MSEKSSVLEILPGASAPLGVSLVDDCCQFAVFLPQVKQCELKIYDMDQVQATVTLSLFGQSEQPGIFTGRVKRNQLPERWGYRYVAAGREFVDPYARKTAGKEKFGVPSELYGMLYEEHFDWQGDQHPHISYHDMILYKLHVRGFTMKATGVRHKGTYRGLLEKKSYLTELGINAVLLLPCVEFEEIIQKTPGYFGIPVVTEEMRQKGIYQQTAEENDFRVNYWGFSAYNCFLAPKAAYASVPQEASKEFKEMVRGLHAEGIEVLMEMNFQEKDNPQLIMDSLIWWAREYHIDGFRINGDVVPVKMAALHPELAGIKLLAGSFSAGWIYGDAAAPEPPVLAEYQDQFQTVVRRFIKGDEEMVGAVASQLERQNGQLGVINFITDNNGFTLADLFSYDVKHNEANQEGNKDGTEYNYSWNCGTEGISRKKKLVSMRMQMRKNALTLLFLAQGTPMLLAGDEFGNSQAGNNNAYCQDNEIGWLSWKEKRTNEELFEFTKELIALRKQHPVFHNITALRGTDYLSCGCPDVSRHGTRAWYPDYSNYCRTLAFLLCGKYAMIDRKTTDSSFYLAANMHWEPHEFDLPAINDSEEFVFLFATDTECRKEVNDKTFVVPARSLVLFQGRIQKEKPVRNARNEAKKGKKALENAAAAVDEPANQKSERSEKLENPASRRKEQPEKVDKQVNRKSIKMRNDGNKKNRNDIGSVSQNSESKKQVSAEKSSGKTEKLIPNIESGKAGKESI